MAEAWLGEIRLIAFNYAPDGWMLCQGQSLPVNQYQALYAIIGNTYGGDSTSFKLPDLRGRAPIQCGVGPLGNMAWGQTGGTNAMPVSTSSAFTLTANQLPSHSHPATFTPTGGGTPEPPTITIKVSNDPAAAAPTGSSPIANGYLGKSLSTAPQQPAIYTSTASSMTTLNSLTATASGGNSGGITGGTVAIGNTGGNQPVTFPIQFQMPAVLPPFIGMNYMICVNGYFPTRP